MNKEDPSGRLIWINGAFGAGKTSVAERLQKQLPGSELYDPEAVGWMLRHLVPPSETGDFQDLPIWRTLVADTAVAMCTHYSSTLIVPMTLVNPQYYREIFDSVHARGVSIEAYSLIVSRAELRNRLNQRVIIKDDPEADARVKKWGLDQVERCARALESHDLGTPVANEGRNVDETVLDLLEQIRSNHAARVL